jgi:signal transduction histidine kinase
MCKAMCFGVCCLMLPLNGFGQASAVKTAGKYSDTAQIRIALKEPHYSYIDIDSLISELVLIQRSSENLKYGYGRLYSNYRLAFSYGLKYNRELSLRYWKKALSVLNEKPGFKRETADIYMSIASVYNSREAFEERMWWLGKAEEYINRNKQNYSNVEDFATDMWQLNYRYATDYLFIEELKIAEKYIKYIIVNSDMSKLYRHVDVNTLNYGKYLILGDYAKALDLVHENMRLVNIIDGNSKRRAGFYNFLPVIYLRMKQYDLAYAYIDSTKKLDRRYSFPKTKIRIDKLQIALDSATGNYSSALQRYSEMESFKDSLNVTNQRSLSAYFQTELEVNNYVQALKTEEVRSEKKSLVIILVSGVGFLSLAIAGLWFARRTKFIRKSHKAEKTEVGNDINDVINPSLHYMRMTIAGLNTSAEEKEKLQGILHTLDSSILEVRKLASWIRKTSEFDDFGKVVSSLLLNESETYGLDIESKLSLNESVLNNSVKHNVYYILDELILNTWKHAGATKVKISLTTQTKMLLVQYGDNGKGFSFEKNYSGVGLSSIRNRAERLDGDIQYQSLTEDDDFTYVIMINIPLKQR